MQGQSYEVEVRTLQLHVYNYATVCVCVWGGGGGGLVVKWFGSWAHDPWVMGSSPTTRR